MNPELRFRPASDEIASKWIDDEVIVLDLAQGEYYSLEDSAALIWQRLEEHKSLGQIAQELTLRYSATRAQVEGDLEEFIENLLACKLITEVAGSA